MGNDGIDLRRALLNEVLGGQADRTTRVGHVIDENRDLALYGTDEDHSGLHVTNVGENTR